MRALIPLFLVLPAVLGCSRDAAPPAATPSPSVPPPPTFRERSLVDRDALEAMLGQPDVRILDTRPLDEYAVAHVPGAVRVDPGIWKAKGHEPGGLVDAAFWSERSASWESARKPASSFTAARRRPMPLASGGIFALPVSSG